MFKYNYTNNNKSFVVLPGQAAIRTIRACIYIVNKASVIIIEVVAAGFI